MSMRIKLVLMAVGLLVVGFSVVDSQAGRRHGHKLAFQLFYNDVVVPPSTDPSTSGVKGVSVECGRGYRATGGGYSSEPIALVPHADLRVGLYEAVAINQTDTAGKLTVRVACIRGKTRATRAGADRSNLERVVRRYRAARQH